ncbi:KilA-N domain-containing protein [Dickeya oryzae]|uniref:KilA-N domain-containing protein n=1 Tax=Dickeya oryzae TaxID=1240404 RepID=UPI001AECAFB4|nr:KilA-N domain-containing protein [Dickeya oryzae]MBP2845411.1 KilA-N domain-containing protein [Dickeya oryzae]
MNTPIIIANVLVRQDVEGRFSLNDLHRAAGGEARHRPATWLQNKQTQELAAEIEKDGIPSILTKQRLGTFVRKELVYAYAMWISPTFNLKVIRAYDSLVQQPHIQPVALSAQVQAGVLLLESAAKTLNLSNSSKLGAYQKLQDLAGLPNLLPTYAIDAPSDAADGSSRATKSLTELLHQNGFTMTAAIAYVRLEAAGIVERKTRLSTGKKTKSFWSVTSQGLRYGKNITSPVNPRETQPHFFESRSDDLLAIIAGRGAA